MDETLAFVTVVEAGTFTEAARRLGVPKSTISRQVSRLEERLGARLLQRTTRRNEPTETGRAYFERCRDAIEQIRDAERLAQDVSGVPKGTLRVSCPFDFGRDHLSRWLVEFRQRYPEIHLVVIMSQARVDLVAERFDVALRGGSLPDSSFVSRKLFASDVVLCASPAYLDRRGRPTSPEELADHDLVSLPLGPRPSMDGPDGPTPVPLEGAWLVANELGFLHRAQLAGLGIGPNILPNVQDDFDAGRLEHVLPELAIRQGGLYAVYPSRHHLSPKVRVFVDFIAEKVAETFGPDRARGR